MPEPISIILPTYNEKDTIEGLLTEIIRLLPQNNEIIVVDDNSPDGTGEIVERLSRIFPQVRLLRRKTRGLTSALQNGIAAARNETIIWMDADFAHPPQLLPCLIEEPDSFDIVLASRYMPGGSDGRKSPLRRIVSVVLNRSGQWIAGSAIRDLSSGYLRVTKDVLRQVPLRGTYGDYCMDFLVRAEKMGYKIKEVPFTNADRTNGYSKSTRSPLIFLRFALLYLKAILKLRQDRRQAVKKEN